MFQDTPPPNKRKCWYHFNISDPYQPRELTNSSLSLLLHTGRNKIQVQTPLYLYCTRTNTAIFKATSQQIHHVGITILQFPGGKSQALRRIFIHSILRGLWKQNQHSDPCPCSFHLIKPPLNCQGCHLFSKQPRQKVSSELRHLPTE